MRNSANIFLLLVAMASITVPAFAQKSKTKVAEPPVQTAAPSYEDDLRKLKEDLDSLKKQYNEMMSVINFGHIWDLSETNFEREVSLAKVKDIAAHKEDLKLFQESCKNENLLKKAASYEILAQVWNIVNDTTSIKSLVSFNDYYTVLDKFTECRKALYDEHNTESGALYNVFSDYVSNVYRLQTLLKAVKSGKNELTQYKGDIECLEKVPSLYSIYDNYRNADESMRADMAYELNRVFRDDVHF